MTEPVQSAQPPAPVWISLPARIIALVIVIPLRLVYDCVRMTGRVIMTVLRGVGRSPGALARLLGAIGRWIADTLLAPVGRVLAAAAMAVWSVFRWIGSGIAAVFDLIVVQPLRWVAVVVIWGFLRLTGRGAGRLGGWFYRTLIDPVARAIWFVICKLGSGVAYVAGAVLALLRLVGSGVAYVASAVWAFLRLIGSGIAWLFERAVVVPSRWLLDHLIVMPAAFLWRFLLLPPLRAVAYVGRLLWATVLGVVAALGWAWHAAGRLLFLLFRLLILVPANAVWLYAIRPVFQGLAWTWRVFVADPARWVRDSVIRPIRDSVKQTWRIAVREPLRQVRLAVRTTMQETRQQIRMQFRGAFRRIK